MKSIKPLSTIPNRQTEILSAQVPLLRSKVLPLAKKKSKLTGSQVSIEDLRHSLQVQLKMIKATADELKISDPEMPKKGKVALSLSAYMKRSQDKIFALEKQMDKQEKGSPMWLRLRKQKLAQKSRFNRRVYDN